LSNGMDHIQNEAATVISRESLSIFGKKIEQRNILDLLLILSVKKRLILLSVFACGLLGTVVAFMVPSKYTSTTVIMPPQQQQASTAMALLGQLQGIPGLASQSLGIKTQIDPYVGILSGRTIADELINRFDLRKIYKEKTLTETRKELADYTTFNSTKYGLIEISVEDRDPKRAADLANAYVDCLQEQNSRLAVTEASQRRLFFEREVEKEKNHLSEAEAFLKKMQEQKGIFQVSSQFEAVIRSMAQMRAEITASEVNLQRLKAGATKDNPEVLRQEIELKALRDQLQKLEANSGERSQGDPLMPTTMVPEAELEYRRNLREVKYHEALFEALAKQYEMARIDEAKESPVIQVVDRAIPADKRTSPKRSIYIGLSVLLGAFIGITLVFAVHAAEDQIVAQKMIALRKSIWMDLSN
jgi:tyrosine-protein kinase Etk/Wzc